MKERPILFSAPMVLAILSGQKTQTRRLVKGPWSIDEHPEAGRLWPLFPSYVNDGDNEGEPASCPYGDPGDRLWVRETFTPKYFDDGRPGYRADWTALAADFCPEPKWKPSIFMPRRESRITLEVTGVRVERLNDISEADARAEGCDAEWCDPDDGEYECEPGQDLGAGDGYTSPRSHVAAYARLWDRINGKRAPWDSNPWVWVVEFRNAVEVSRGR